ncbi:hypothetical protein MBRA1_001106 [Malassezia brasiliensis]|uniref:Nickel/cobalt efflux system n=1 Tax=Malassezia brasiliensis TaxID=1821822 RepID=A0AAF0DRS6_9BASI|nr:hypothetical protein MBRA1_001106 [Malassezia brasiliensis]
MARRLTILARGIPLLGALVALNAVLWVITAVTFSVFQHRIKGEPDETTRQAEKLLTDNADDVAKRSGTLMSFALVAWATGLRHALDADHISAIDNATRRIMAVPRKHGPGYRRPVTVGLWFSLGHSTIVIAVLIAIAVSFTVYARMNTVSDVGGIIGASVSGSFLFIIGVINSIILIRSIHSLRMERKRTRDSEHGVPTAGVEVVPKGEVGQTDGAHEDTAGKTDDTNEDTAGKTDDTHKDTAAQRPGATVDAAADNTLAQSTQIDVHTDPHLHRRSDSAVVEAPESDERNTATPAAPEEVPKRHTEFRGLFTRLTGPLLRAIDRPWKMYPIGILFGLGFDTASTISLLAIAVIASSSLSGNSEANGSVVLLAFLFTAGMMLADSCDAVLMVCAYAWEELQAQPKWYSIWIEVPDEHPEHDHDLLLNDDDAPGVPDMAHEIAVSTTPFTLFLTLLSIIIAFAVSIIEILGLIGSECSQCSAAADRQAETHDGGLAGRWWLWWRWCNDNFGWIGIGITGAFFLAVGIALGVTIYLSKRRSVRRAHL